MGVESPASAATAGPGPTRRRRVALPALVAALALLVGAVLGTVLARDGKDGPAPTAAAGVDLADDDARRLVDATITSLNAADVEAVASSFTEDAVLTDLVTDRITTGSFNIALAYGQTEDLRLRRTSDVVAMGDYVVFTVEDATGPGLVVAEVVDARFADYVVMAH
jgi:hypothetical protein